MVQFLFIVPRRDQGVSFGKGSKKNCLLSSNPKGGFQRVVVSQLEKKQCESARCAIRPRKLESDEIRYFHACSPSKFVALVVQDGWDDIGCQLHRYFCFSHKRLAT